ncbi:hypothetical protein H0Z60_10060 [Ectothiorhodospiraceae bacterium WFHF3C12]|nr:hypothetical protein [Ectothiorhodospiraceae bacterium WFHF3C12]
MSTDFLTVQTNWRELPDQELARAEKHATDVQLAVQVERARRTCRLAGESSAARRCMEAAEIIQLEAQALDRILGPAAPAQARMGLVRAYQAVKELTEVVEGMSNQQEGAEPCSTTK